MTMAHNLQFKTNPVSTFQDKKEKQVGKTSKAKGKKAKNADAEAEALLDAFGEENEEDGDEVQKEADTTDAAEAVPPSQTGDDAQDMMAAGIEFLRFKNQQISRDVKAGTQLPSSAIISPSNCVFIGGLEALFFATRRMQEKRKIMRPDSCHFPCCLRRSRKTGLSEPECHDRVRHIW